MFKSLALHVACLAAVGLLLAPAVGAQEVEEPTWDVKWSNGHKMDKSDGAFKLKFGGRIQADFIFASQNDDIDEALGEDAFRTASSSAGRGCSSRARSTSDVKFKAQYDFAGGDADFKDVWIA